MNYQEAIEWLRNAAEGKYVVAFMMRLPIIITSKGKIEKKVGVFTAQQRASIRSFFMMAPKEMNERTKCQ